MANAAWAQFHRFQHAGLNFFGIVNAEGEWVDSAVSFDAAISFCCMADGFMCDSIEQGIAHVSNSKWSIIKGPMLKQMYEAGLIS